MAQIQLRDTHHAIGTSQSTTTGTTTGSIPLQAPSVKLTPAHSAWQAFEYVLPSAPQTGLSILLHTQTLRPVVVPVLSSWAMKEVSLVWCQKIKSWQIYVEGTAGWVMRVRVRVSSACGGNVRTRDQNMASLENSLVQVFAKQRTVLTRGTGNRGGCCGGGS